MDFATIAMDIDFTSDTAGLSAVAVNGQGAFVWQTVDAGQTWNAVPERSGLGFMGAACKGDSAVVAGMFDLQYSHVGPNKYNFSESTISGALGITSQDVEARDDAFYAAVGNSVSGQNGVAISRNSGQNFKFYNVKELQTSARYGAYPTVSTWYISAGEWPDTRAVDTTDGSRQISRRIHIQHKNNLQQVVPKLHGPRAALPADHPNSNGNSWKAQIVKTDDGGQTWTSVYYDEGNFYFNYIDCAPNDATHCCAAGEADTGSQPGIRILCTWDAGKTWTQTLTNTKRSMSIMPLKFIDGSTVWAGGGDMSPPSITGYFWNSTDGGKIWAQFTIKNVYIDSMVWFDSIYGFATAFNSMSTSALF